jgi:ribosomal protein S18 acetylase RimI-like enzyme
MPNENSVDFRVRPLLVQEIPEVISLLLTCGLHCAEDDNMWKLTQKMRRDSDLMLAAVSDDRVIGFIMASYDSWAAMLWHFCVLPEFRGTKVADALMREILERLKARGADIVYALTKPNNERMLKFAAKRGFLKGPKFHVLSKPLDIEYQI